METRLYFYTSVKLSSNTLCVILVKYCRLKSSTFMVPITNDFVSVQSIKKIMDKILVRSG